MAAPRLSAEAIAEIRRVYARTGNKSQTALETGRAYGTVMRHVQGEPGPPDPATGHPAPPLDLPDPHPEAGGPDLPDPFQPPAFAPYRIDGPAVVGLISDVHIPYHDKTTIYKWVDECKRRNASVMFVNGDLLDCYYISDHYKERNLPKIRDEILMGRAFFEWLRSQFPKARLIFKYGNHDERLRKYVGNKAPELFELEELDLASLLKLTQYSVEAVACGEPVNLGALPTVHGHEFRVQGGVMPARWLYLRTGSSALCGHFHRPSFYPFRTLENKQVACYSMGCACYLTPAWLRFNQWEHGYAVVTLEGNGHYQVDNRRILTKDGSVV